MKKNFLKDILALKNRSTFLFSIGGLFILILALVTTLELNSLRIQRGVDAVNYLYNFGTVKELDRNMDKLKKITSNEIYQKLTIDNSDRALNTYLKFKNVSCAVKVINSTKNYVLYTLETDALSSGRKFIFMYETNIFGKIVYVREAETIDFYNDN